MTKTIEMAKQADAYADEVLGKGEYHPNWHEVRDERFAALVRAQVLEEAAQVCEQHAGTVSMFATSKDAGTHNRAVKGCAAVLRGMKSGSGHSVSSVAGASTAPAQRAWDDLPDSLKAHPGVKALYRALLDAETEKPLTDERACASTAPLPCVACITPAVCKRDARCFHPTSPRQDQREWPAGLIDRVKAAAKRIDDNRAPRSIPADPRSDVDLVLAEVRCFLEGSAPPFWLWDAPRCRSADTVRHAPNRPDESIPGPSAATPSKEQM